MRCPWCAHPSDKVVDSRGSRNGEAIRRRRECLRCGRRFTTFERVEEARLLVIKRDGSKEPFDRAKVAAGITKAVKNRPVGRDQVEGLAARSEEKLRLRGPAVTTQEVGIEVLGLLRGIDDVAYLRFASVYKDFQELTDFERELGILLQKRDRTPGVGKASRGRGRSAALPR